MRQIRQGSRRLYLGLIACLVTLVVQRRGGLGGLGLLLFRTTWSWWLVGELSAVLTQL